MPKIKKFVEISGEDDEEALERLLCGLLAGQRDLYRNIGDTPALRIADACEIVLRALSEGYDA